MLEPIAQGDRGPAVEDVQKRLLVLGFDLGPTGIDGVFLGATLAAVRRFQHERGLSEDGTVGDETWAALVDATFRLGDRLLYLRYPYLHGADVSVLQGALNVLGFACGPPDGIFGAFTERAVGEFQSNVGLPRDGIAGPETVRAIERLRHVWQDKDPSAPVNLPVAPARAAAVLRAVELGLVCVDDRGRAVAERLANLATATEPEARVRLCDITEASACTFVLFIGDASTAKATEGVPVIRVSGGEGADGRFVAAFASAAPGVGVYIAVPDEAVSDEHVAQSAAVRILDGLCAVLSGGMGPVVL
ncbi:MAG: peptidoglycan-binding protein [Coriobacteriia bacterium]|nr:peptidoglycan-binding protein [Coriobacteriia bacterium]MBN2840794.1 peptidoglycan-binding protein [Coriobacteriia bacterium]